MVFLSLSIAAQNSHLSEFIKKKNTANSEEIVAAAWKLMKVQMASESLMWSNGDVKGRRKFTRKEEDEVRGGRIESLGIYKETEHLLPYHIPASVCGGGGGWRWGV